MAAWLRHIDAWPRSPEPCPTHVSPRGHLLPSPAQRPPGWPGCEGRLGLCFCPGKKVKKRDARVYDRDLTADLDQLQQRHGVGAIVCLLNDAELRVRPAGTRGAGRGELCAM